jgi:3',5'-cyclic AMP phosphodiesterase CpdA
VNVRIAQISDLHFGRTTDAVAENLLAELRDVDATLVTVCGDLPQRARDTEFQAASTFLSRLPAPALVVPGNHDLPVWPIWTRIARPWHRWRRQFGANPADVTTHSGDGLTVVGLNTARRSSLHVDWSRGRVNGRQVAAALQVFEEAPRGDLRVLVAHHPFLLEPRAGGRGLVGRSDRALRQLRRRADLLLGGHLHLAYSGVADGLVVAQSGTTLSNRLRGEPNSYNLIEADGDQLTVETRQWNGDRFDTYGRSTYARRDLEWSLLQDGVPGGPVRPTPL